MPPQLPPLPAISVGVHRDRTAGASATGGFLDVRRLDLVATYPDGSTSTPFSYDIAVRKSLDAVIVIAHYRENGQTLVLLRSAVRPPCALRDRPPSHDGSMWELPAGLIDGDETPEEAGARELLEELGVKVDAGALEPLGPWTFPVPGFCGERQVFFHVAIDPSARTVPTEDGSALERHARICAVSVREALDACRRGDIRDTKTELALRRFEEQP